MIWLHNKTRFFTSHLSNFIISRRFQHAFLLFILSIYIEFITLINLYSIGYPNYANINSYLRLPKYTNNSLKDNMMNLLTFFKATFLLCVPTFPQFLELLSIKVFNLTIGEVVFPLVTSLLTFLRRLILLRGKVHGVRHANFYILKKNVKLLPSFFRKDLTVFLPIYNSMKSFFLPISVTLLIVVTLLDYYNINFTRQIAIWFVVGIMFFWLMSGFNFFLKRYRFGKFTSAIQRFWKRTNSYFWIVEGFLFSLFFYYYLNSSQEVLYFFDEVNLSQTFLTNLPSLYFSYLLFIFLIFYSLYLIMNLPSFSFKQNLAHLTIITVFYIYGFLLETYQFYYILNGFFELTWSFDDSQKIWTLDANSPWIRVKQQYITLALIAKYWHFLFIFISWLFMLFKAYETRTVTYVLFGVSLQNYMLLFLLNILFNINWLKWLSRRHFDEIYYWFFSDFNNVAVKLFSSEFYNLCISFI